MRSPDALRKSRNENLRKPMAKKPHSQRRGSAGSRSRARAANKAASKSSGDGLLSPERIESIKRALLRKREELLRQQSTHLSALQGEDRGHLADLEEMTPDSTDADSVCALVDLSSSTISEIDLALEKIRQGTYGACDLCGKPIAPERLEVRPFASLCIHCQREKETQRDFEVPAD